MHAGILTALLPEARCLTKKAALDKPIQLTDRITLYISGMGVERVRRGTELLLSSGADALVSIGTAGALHSKLKPGAIIIPENVISPGGESRNFTADWRFRVLGKLSLTTFAIHSGTLTYSNGILSSPEEKVLLNQKTAAIAVDMESGVIADIACDNAIPVLALRTIADSATMTIPGSVIANTDPFGNVKLPALLSSLLSHPEEIPDMIKLVKGFRSAATTLRWLARHLEDILLLP